MAGMMLLDLDARTCRFRFRLEFRVWNGPRWPWPSGTGFMMNMRRFLRTRGLAEGGTVPAATTTFDGGGGGGG
jgi:hypothetical protein